MSIALKKNSPSSKRRIALDRNGESESRRIPVSPIRDFHFPLRDVFQKRRQAAALQSASCVQKSTRCFADPPFRRLRDQYPAAIPSLRDSLAPT